MTKRIFKKYADIAKYRISMKRQLRIIGCQVNNTETTEHLEEMMRIGEDLKRCPSCEHEERRNN